MGSKFTVATSSAAKTNLLNFKVENSNTFTKIGKIEKKSNQQKLLFEWKSIPYSPTDEVNDSEFMEIVESFFCRLRTIKLI